MYSESEAGSDATGQTVNPNAEASFKLLGHEPAFALKRPLDPILLWTCPGRGPFVGLSSIRDGTSCLWRRNCTRIGQATERFLTGRSLGPAPKLPQTAAGPF
jgi:hypothetical protein